MSKWYVGSDNSRYLAHFGILNMRWGIRRFQNSDGSLTPAGKERYSKGTRKLTNKDGSLAPAGEKLYNKTPKKFKNNPLVRDAMGYVTGLKLAMNKTLSAKDIGKYDKSVQKYYWAIKNPKRKPENIDENFWKEIQRTRKRLRANAAVNMQQQLDQHHRFMDDVNRVNMINFHNQQLHDVHTHMYTPHYF